MAFRSPITKLSQLIADKLVAKDSRGNAVTLDPEAYETDGGPGIVFTSTATGGAGTATAYVREQAYDGGAASIEIGATAPDGTESGIIVGTDNIAINGIVRLNANTGDNNLAGLTGGSDTVTFDANGVGQLAHGLNAAPTGVSISSANKTVHMAVASVDAVTIVINAQFLGGATWTAGDRVVHWVAVVTQAVV